MTITINNKLLGLILVLMLCCFNSFCQDPYCLTHASCTENDAQYDFLAPCIRHANNQKAHCNTEALASYYDYQVCTPMNCKAEEKNYCKNNPCQNNGECRQMFGSYSCLCPRNYHGRNCTEPLQTGIRPVSGVYFLFNKITSIKTKSMIYIFLNDPGDDMKISIYTGDSGEVIETNKDHMKIVQGKKKCKKQKLKEFQCRHIPDTDMMYQSLQYEIVYNIDDSVIMEYYPKENIPYPGFKVNHLSIKIYNKQKEEFSQTFNQVVSYRREICPIQVVITQNCGMRSDKPLKISRKSNKVIGSFLKKTTLIETECPNQILNYKWNIFEVGTKFWTSWLSPVASESGTAEYNVERFKWKFGLYKVKLTVSVSGLKHVDNVTEHYNSDYSGICFIEIIKVPLEVNIEGGILRTVSHFERFALDASQSYDPNEPRHQQSHLQWIWTCNGTAEFCKPNYFKHGLYEFADGLPEGVLEFTLTLQTTDGSNNPVTATQTIVISELPQVQIDISCLKNCGIADFKSNPKEIVYLEASVKSNFNISNFLWTFYVDESTQESNADEIAQDNIKSNILIIKENTLKIGLKYTFKVRPANALLRGSSSITIIVTSPPKKGACSISPEVGQAAITEFSIICSSFYVDDDITQLSYEFFQKMPEQEYPGTMLGYSISGELKNVILTQKHIVARIYGVYGMYTDVNLQVRLDDWEQASQNIEQLLSTLKTKRLAGDSRGCVIIAGAIMDVMGKVQDKLSMIKQVLESLKKDKFSDFSEVKLYTSVLRKIMKTGIPQLENGIDSKAVKIISAVMASLSKSTLTNVVSEDKKESLIILDDIKSISSTMLECTDVILNSKDISIFDTSSSNRAMFASHDNYKTGTADVIAALHWSGLAILTMLMPHEKETIIEAKDSLMWLKIEDPDILANLSSIPQNSTSNIKLSKLLGMELKTYYDNVAIKVTTFKRNPFWWDLEKNSIGSEVISVRIWERSKVNKLLTEVSKPLDVYFSFKNITFKTISGNVIMPNVSGSEDHRDSSVAVHVLEAPPENSNGKLFVEFINLQSTKLRVLLSVNLRPDYRLMISNAQIISSNFTTLELSYENITADTLHFVGILPSVNTAAYQLIAYTFKTYSVQCKLRHLTVWASPACTIGDKSSNSSVHCRCSHLSFFGSSVFVAPNTVHPIKDLYLLMTVKDNPLVFTIVISLLVLYVMLLTWSKTKERRDKLKRKVIVVEDNFPGEVWSYLVVVYTAFNIGSDTGSNVGIRLIGKNGPSRAHILGSRSRKVFRRNADDWFLLFTSDHLGDLEFIHIWHDNAGSNPDWYCRKVHVYDLNTEKQYTFMVEQWLSVRPGEYPEAVIKVLGPRDNYDWKKIFVHNLVYHLQENHLWASIFICHPRATVTKSQRLTITFCLIFVSFLTGIMFYGVARGQVIEDESRYTIQYREIIVALQSIVISAVVTSIVILCFRKSNTVLRPKEITSNNDSLILDVKYRNRINKKRDYTLLHIFSRTIYIMVKGKPLLPVLVGVESYESVIRRRNWGITGWIISQLTIWISAFFIVLYGLKLGRVISKLWVTSALLSFVQGILINAPVKIVAFSTILAMFGEMYKVETFECDIIAAMQQDRFGDEDFLYNLLAMRSSNVYKPLSPEKVNELRNSFLKWSGSFNKIEFGVAILFLLILMCLTGYLWVGYNYYINSHITLCLTSSLRKNEVVLEDADNIKKLTSYLIINWIPRIFKGRWYNRKMNLTSTEELRSETGWFMDATHRMVGTPRLRQIRVKHDYCPFFMFNIEIDIKTYCFPALESNTLDTDSYGLKWAPVDIYVNKPLLKPWTYNWEPGCTMFGESNNGYPSGGYIAVLTDNQRTSASAISDLKDLQWFNVRLRALFSELNLFNVNTNTHTVVIIISEHLPSGAMTNKIHITTIYLSINYTLSLLFAFLLVVINAYFIISVNRIGIFGIISSFWSCFDLFLVVLGDICVLFHWFVIFKSTMVTDSFQRTGDNGFIHLSNIIFYRRISLPLWALLMCLATIRILKFKCITSLCKVASYTLYRSKNLLAVESIVIITIISIQILIINFAICPGIQSLDVGSKFHLKKHSSIFPRNYNITLGSLMLSVTCSSAILFIQITLIQMYKSTRYWNKMKR